MPMCPLGDFKCPHMGQGRYRLSRASRVKRFHSSLLANINYNDGSSNGIVRLNKRPEAM